jgi:DMSO/TMAO reductase YedYZ molybdopterin-dependent catalytic subunit
VLAAAKPPLRPGPPCADNRIWPGWPPEFTYESLDILEIALPQTILAYELNNEALPIQHGGAVRLRAERHLGNKMAKYIKRIELVPEFSAVAGWARRLLGGPRLLLVCRNLNGFPLVPGQPKPDIHDCVE